MSSVKSSTDQLGACARTWCVTVVRGTTYITTFSHHVATCECSVYNTGTGYWIANTAHELAESRPSSSSYSSASTPLPPVKIVGCGDRAGRIPPNFFAISHTVLKCNPYQSPRIESQ